MTIPGTGTTKMVLAALALMAATSCKSRREPPAVAESKPVETAPAPAPATPPESSCGPAPTWSTLLPVKGEDFNSNATANGVAFGAEGRVFAVGTLLGKVQLKGNVPPMATNGESDLFVAALDPRTGDAIWNVNFGDQNAQTGEAVAANTAGQVAVIGRMWGKMSVGRQQDGGSDEIAYIAGVSQGSGAGLFLEKATAFEKGSLASIAADPTDQNFVVCGVVPDKGGERDTLVQKINAASGAVLWSRPIGGAGEQFCRAIAVSPGGAVFLTGSNLGKVWIAKLAGSTGAVVWQRLYDQTTGSQVPRGIAVDQKDDVVITGGFVETIRFSSSISLSAAGPAHNLSSDVFVAKLAGSDAGRGAAMWARRWGDERLQYGTSVSVDSHGDVYAVGMFRSKIDADPSGPPLVAAAPFVPDAYIVKLAGGTGKTVCARRFGDAANQAATHVVTGPQDVILIAGSVSGAIDFGRPTEALRTQVPRTFLVEYPL